MKKTPTKAKFVEKPGENAATGKVSLSGRMVNGKQDQFLDASEMGMMKWMILMGKRAAKVAWLFLADDETQTKTDMVNLMQYMAFLAAFLTSICIAYMLGVPGMDWEYIANQWGCEGNHTTFDLGQKGNCDNSMSGEDIVRLHRDIVSVLSFGSTICFLLTMVHTVITMAMIQQTTGDVEAFRFKQKQEINFALGLLLFAIGIGFFALLVLYHYWIYSSSLVAALVGIGIALTLVGYYFVGIFWFQMVAIYEVKAESYHNSPIALSSAECDALTMEFIDVTGVELMSGPRLCQFVCQKFTAGRAQGKGKKDVPCVLAEGTTALLNAMATIANEEYVQSSLKKSKVKTALDSVLTEMESVSA